VLGALAGVGEKLLEVVRDDLVEGGLGGFATLVARRQRARSGAGLALVPGTQRPRAIGHH
jgi:hypothetical protein